MKLTNREIDLILAFAMLILALFVTLGLFVSVFGQVYEDGSFVIKGCIPFMICQ